MKLLLLPRKLQVFSHQNISHLINRCVLSLQRLLQPRRLMQELRKEELDGQQSLSS